MPFHVWIVDVIRGQIRFRKLPKDRAFGFLRKLFYSVFFYKSAQLNVRNSFSFGTPRRLPLGILLRATKMTLAKIWVLFRSATYTRFMWSGEFAWSVENEEESLEVF